MSIDRRVMATALGALFCTTAQAVAPDAIDLPTAQAQAQLLDMLEKESLYRDRVDWRAIRTRLKAAQNDPAEVRAVLRQAIGRSSGGHGTDQRKAAAGEGRTPGARQWRSDSGSKATTALAGAPDPRIGWVEIEGYGVMQARRRTSR